MTKIDTHGLEIHGLEKLAEDFKKVEFKNTATHSMQVFYDKKTKEVWGTIQSLNWNTSYKSDDVLNCGHHRKHLTAQGIADVVYKAVLEEIILRDYCDDDMGILYDCKVFKQKGDLVITSPDTVSELELVATVSSGKIYLA